MFPFASRQSSGPATPQVTPQEVAEQLQSAAPPLLLDVRTSEEFDEAHIEGARLLPLVALPLRVDEVPRDQPVVVLCRSGARSSSACEVLAAQGFRNIQNMKGGMLAWQKAGLPVHQ